MYDVHLHLKKNVFGETYVEWLIKAQQNPSKIMCEAWKAGEPASKYRF